MLSIIVAKSKNNVIGKDNRLIWYLPDDLKRFKQITTNHNIIMGRKTFESLGKILPNRYHIVLSKDKNFRIESTQVKVINDISLLDKYIESDEEIQIGSFVKCTITDVKEYDLIARKIGY